MLRRSSGSTDEGDSEEPIASKPRSSGDDDGTRKSFTSAKYDTNRRSDTLDRRKAEKSFAAAQLLDRPWSLEPDSYEGSGKKRHNQTLDARLHNPILGKMSNPREWSRVRSPWRCSLLTLVTTAFSILLLGSILHSFLTRQVDPKGCKNCMMRPAYAKLSGFDTEHTRFASKYSLYLYREGGIDEDTMVKGVPVLFITGNAGSYKQVRPIAAEAAHYFHDYVQQDSEAIRGGTRNLDFFTADFNEDITAFHGQTLLDQAEYLNEAVAYILSLYHDPNRSRQDPGLPDPSSVILIGHSMGGIVARTMLVMPNYQSNSVNTILTMSAPHARPPVSFDSDMVRTYQKINDYWRQAYSQKWANQNPLWHVTLISIAGGGLDTVIQSDYTSLQSLVPETHGFTVFTSSMPNVWTGSDHLSILWCDQLRKVIVRSLIDIVDARRSGQTKPRAERMRIFKRWYLTGMEEDAEKLLPQKEPSTLLTLEDNSNSIVPAGERLVLREFGYFGKAKAYLLPVPPQPTFGAKKFTLLTDQPIDSPGAGGKLEILFCSVFPLQAGQSATLFSMDMDLSGASTGSTRLACKNAASDIILLPASTRTSKFSFDEARPFSYLEFQLQDLADHQFITVVDKSKERVSGWAIAEFADHADSQMDVEMSLGRLLTSGLRMQLHAERPIMTEVKIPAIRSSILAYKLALGTQVCGDGELFTPLLRQYLSIPHESKYFVNVKEANINLHGMAPFMPPPLHAQATPEGITLQLWSDPTCNTSIEMTLQVDVLGSLGKLSIRYQTVLAAFPLFIVALVLRKQFMVYDESGVFISFVQALDLCLRSSLPALLLAMSFFALCFPTTGSESESLPSNPFHWRGNATGSVVDYAKNDLLLGSQDPFFWFLIPMFGIISIGICFLLNYAVLLVIQIIYVIYSTLTARPAWIRNNDRRQSSNPGFAAVSPKRRIIITSILLLMVSTIIPYQFAYMVACIVQIATCTRALRLARETRSGDHYNFYNYVHSILVLMIWILPINLPVLVVWIHNLAVHWLTPFSSHHNVLSIMPFIVLVETLTGGKMIPRVTSKSRYITNTLFSFLSIYAAVYGVTYAYQLHHVTNFVCAWLVAVHFSGTSLSLSSLSQMLEGDDEEGNPKRKA